MIMDEKDIKNLMKKKSKVIIGVLLAAMLLSGCGKDKKTVEDTQVNESTVAEEAAVSEETEGKEESEPAEELIDDPLANNTDVTFIGDMGRDDNITRKIVAKLLDETDISAAYIQTVCCSDFEMTEEYAAYVFVGEFIGGEEGEEYAEEYYEGTLYFVTEDYVKELEQPVSGMWHDAGELLDFGIRQYFYINEHYTTGLVSQLWTVRDGKAFEDEISRWGYLYPSTETDGYELVHSTYDGTFDRELNDMLGHTWKSYYCDFDEGADTFVEYAGSEIDVSDIDIVCKNNYTETLMDEDEYVLNAYVRPNGIVNINYLKPDEYEVGFGNLNYNLETGKLVQAIDYGADEFDNSNYGGIYYSSFTNAEGVYRDDIPKPETVETYLYVYSCNNLVDLGGYQIIYGDIMDQDGYNPQKRAFIIDSNTKLEGVPNGGLSAMEWMSRLADPDEDMMLMGDTLLGVFGFDTTGAHVDRVFGQYWWD